MNNFHEWVLHKVPIWMTCFLVLGWTVFSGEQLLAQSIELEDIHVHPLDVQAGECRTPTAHYVTRDFDNFYFQGIVPLTGNLNLVIDSEVDIAFCALEELTDGILTVKSGTPQDNRVPLDTLKLTGLTPCDTIYFEVKSYDFRVGREIRTCLYEPQLLVDCDAPVPTILTDSNAGINGNYKPNENYTTVICPDNKDKRFTSLQFSDFWLQQRDLYTGNCSDYVQLLNGDSPHAEPLEIDGKTKFCGDDLAGRLVFPDNWPNGCITLAFHSNNDTIVGTGWTAELGCDACNLNFDAQVSRNCLGSSGTRRIDVLPTGGSGDYEYQLGSGSTQSVGTFFTSTFPAVITIIDQNDHTCSFSKVVLDDSERLALAIDKIIPTNCEGEGGGIVVKVSGGAAPYEFDLQGNGLTGGHTVPTKVNDSIYVFSALDLNQFDPASGLPLSKTISVELADANGCLTSRNTTLYSSCANIICDQPSAIATSSEEIAYYCSEDDISNLILDTFSIGNAATGWLISDTAIVHIFEGQGAVGTLVASYSRANPPQPADFPLFTDASCLTVFIENDVIGGVNNQYAIETSCAACDYAIEVIERNADCQDAEGKAFIKVVGSSDYTITLEGSFPLYSRQVQGGEVLEVAGLIEGRYTFKIVENWFFCTQYITVDIGRNSGPEILDIDVTNETCDKQSTPNASAIVTATGGSGQFLYSISGDAFGSTFFNVPLDGTVGDLDPRPDTVAFAINNLEGNGYLTSANAYALVVKDATLTAANCKAEATLRVGDNCFNKKCEGTFFDNPVDAHVMATDSPLSRGNYDDSTPFTAVVCPNIHDKFVTVDFDTFYVAIGDTLRVFDSTGVAAQEPLLIGTYTGFGLNGRSVTATNPTGCLTFQFTPNNDGITRIGWFANIECHYECDLTLREAWVGKETCESAQDGSINLEVYGGSCLLYTSPSPRDRG